MRSTKELILYKEQSELFLQMTAIIEEVSAKEYRLSEADAQRLKEAFYECFHQLMGIAASHGFQGNLWHNYLAYLIANNENAYSKACEICGETEGSINEIASHDFTILKELFTFDFSTLGTLLEIECMDALLAYRRAEQAGKIYNARIRDRICELGIHLEEAKDVAEFQRRVTEFYRDFGVGKLGLHKAFRVRHTENGAEIEPITNIAHVTLDDLVGYEIPKQKLIENTEAFVKGKEANNCLLFGDAGTGKSSSIKAIINRYYDDGLRMIEIYKHQFGDLQDVIAQIKNRNYKFIIYMDDLSFEEFEIEYKYLKAVIEGGLEKKPKNILIYATSNRRHLIRENFSDKEEIRQDMHTSDTVQEKLSLVYRFGVSIYFGAPSKKEFQEIVKVLAKKNNIRMSEETLLAEANKWELSHGGLSGRTAQQFIDYLSGTKEN